MARGSLFFSTGGGGDYAVDYSCIFNGTDESMNRTPGVAGDQTKFTISLWSNIDTASVNQVLFGVDGAGDTDGFEVAYLSTNKIAIGSVLTWWRQTTATYSATATWRHILVAVDTSLATANDRIKLYVDESQVTGFSTLNNPSQSANMGINRTAIHHVGRYPFLAIQFYDGKIADFHLIDGQALTPSSFVSGGSPIEYTGSYGTNGFHMDFANSSSLGEDAAGSNDYTTVNMDATNQSTDVPT